MKTCARVARVLIVLATTGVLLFQGCSTVSVEVERDSAIPIPPGSTWAWGQEPLARGQDQLDPRVNNPTIHGRVKQAVEAVLAEKGFRLADAASAAFLVEYQVGMKDTRRRVSEERPAGMGYGYYDPPTATREVRYTEGALLIDMRERSTGKLAYRAVALDSAVTHAGGSEAAIQKVVTRLFQDLP